MMALISRRPTSAVSSIKALKILKQMLRCSLHDRSDCSTLSSFVESSSSSYLHLHELISLSLFGASGPEVVLKYIALGFPSFRQQQSLRTSYSQVSAKTNEVKRMGHLIKTTTSFSEIYPKSQSEFFQMIISNSFYAKGRNKILWRFRYANESLTRAPF